MATRILLVEDNPGDAVIFREKLNASNLDYQLIHAKRLSEGLERVEGDAFDILMVDLSLPDAQGMEAVDQLREAAPDSPLIVLTGLDDATAAADAKQRGAVDYLVKWYVDSVSLARYVRYAIEQYRTRAPETDVAPAPEPGQEDDALAEVEGVVFDADEEGSANVEGGEGSDEAAPAAPQQDPASPEPVRPGKAEPPPDAPASVQAATSSFMREAASAALAFARQSQQQSAWLADVLCLVLDLDREPARKPELIDVLDLLNQKVREHRSLAMAQGLPVKTSSQRKKVMAYADRNLVDQILTRVVVDAVHDARHDGVRLNAEVEGEESTVRARWHSASEDREAHAELGRRLVEHLAERAGGGARYETDATGEHTLTIRLPGRPDA